MKTKKLIYLADPTHAKRNLGSSVPLNIGYLKSALVDTFSDDVEVVLFKYPEKLLEAIEKRPPDILGLSNYMWNRNLSLFIAKYVKEKISKNVFIVFGGPNVRYEPEHVNKFLIENPVIDAYTPLQAELGMVELVKNVFSLEDELSAEALYDHNKTISGVALNIQGHHYTNIDEKEYGSPLDFASPYLKGYLDEFITDSNLIPNFETNRGCPYACIFCAWGLKLLNKVRQRDAEIINKEFEYVAKNGAQQGYWIISDANFGMYKRDVEFAKKLVEIKSEYGYPKRVNINWSKKSGEHILEMIKLMQEMAPAQIAAQSFDDHVLVDLKRKNLKDDHADKLKKFYESIKIKTFTDILVGSKEESLESHYSTLRKAFDKKFDMMFINNIFLLPGTEMENDEYRSSGELKTEYRIIPGTYGTYKEQFVYETEEVIKATKSLKLEEMNDLRVTHFLIYFFWNLPFAAALLKFIQSLGTNPLDVILDLQYNSQDKLFYKDFQNFYNDAKDEYFADENEIKEYFDNKDNLDNFLNSRGSAKLTWKYVVKLLNDPEKLKSILESMFSFSTDEVSENMKNVIITLLIDRVKIDFDDNTNFTKHYSLSLEEYEQLVKYNFIDEEILYNQSGIHISYNYDDEKYEYVKEILNGNGYNKDKVSAIGSVLSFIPIEYLFYERGNHE